MRKLIAIVQTSFDGFVAGPNGEFTNFIGDEENLAFVCSLIESADAILFGRKSWQLLESNWPTAADKPGATAYEVKYSNWYNSVPKYVLSKTVQTSNDDNSVVIRDNVAEKINSIKQQDGKSIYVFGSPTVVHFLLQENLLDGIWLIMHPVFFGKGIPLHRELNNVIKLNLASTKHLSSGTFCLNYEVERGGANS
ncbi:dihydrofolate reductase family protein [Chitinophagaceae bacterium 26-R-25]|nr:dihydrofolate reductase family protein [Chitinophagaceae bacterium 26-R-25]